MLRRQYGIQNRLLDITDQTGAGTHIPAALAGKNGPQGRILYVLWQKDEVPIVELSQKTGLAKNTLTAMLGRMEEAGLIARKAAESDKRQSLISLTEKARDLQGKYDEVSQKMNEIFYKDFAEAEVKEMDQFLDRILENLEQSEKSPRRGKEE